MHQKRFGIIFSFILLGIVLLAVFFFINGKKESDILTLYGNVDVRQVDIGFRVSGKVTGLFFEEGDYVEKGKLMATLEKTPYDSEAEAAKSNVDSIKSAFENAEVLLKRRENLIASGGVSKEDLDNARTNRDELYSRLKQAEANLKSSLDRLSYTESFAPNDGIVFTRVREAGAVVKESDPVYTLSLTTPVWVRAFVDEENLGNVFYGMEARIFTDTKNAPVYKGKVGFISPMAEFTPKTVETTSLRTDLVYRIRIYIDQPDAYLKQGMPVTVKLSLKQPKSESFALHERS